MITGFNQDVPYKGKVYHVQTEDRGKGNPIIETLIYAGGEILASRKSSYAEMMETGYDETKVVQLLEQQHRRIIVEVKLGKFAKEESKPFGEGIVTGKSLDEVILDYLTSESEGEKLVVTVVDQSEMAAGVPARVQIKAATEISGSPVAGAVVTAKITTSDGQTNGLFSGVTAATGLCAAAFTIPAVSENAVVIVEVAHAKGNHQIKYLVARKA